MFDVFERDVPPFLNDDFVVLERQHVGRRQYECPQASEELAYEVQQKWLGLFGRSLESEFEIDPFTLLVSVRCAY